MKKKIKSLFYSLSVASFLLLGCAGIPIDLDYSCSATDDSSDVSDSSMQEYENLTETISAEKWFQFTKQESSSQAVTEAETQPGSEKLTEENNTAESTESVESTETDITESKNDSDSEKKGSFAESLRNNVISILLFLGGLVCGFTIACAFNFMSNEKSKKKQLKDLRKLSRDIKNAKIKIEDLNATSSELKELSNRIKAVDDILKKF